MAEFVKWQDFPKLSPEEYKVESAIAGTFDPIDITKLSPEDLAARRQAAGRRAVQTGYATDNLSPEERSLYPRLAGGTTGTFRDYLPRFLASGTAALAGNVESFLGATRRALGAPEYAKANEAEAARQERIATYFRPPEYNRSIFEAPSLGAAAGQALYTVGEMIPTLAATAATLPVTGPLGTAFAGSRVAAPLVGALATRAPQFMGGGAGLAPAAAQQAGQRLLGAATTIAAGSYPTITGEIASKVRRAAEKQDREMTRGEALGVLATGVPAAIIEGVGFAPTLRTARAGFGGGLANFARGTAAQSGTGAFQETAQEALGQMAARDFSGRELLEAGVMGALVNPILERGARVTSKSVDFVRSRLPNSTTNDDLKRAVDDNLTTAAPSIPPTPEVPQGYLFGPQTEGRYFGSPNQTSAAPVLTEPQTAAPINRAQLDLFETQGELLPRGETLTNLAGPYGVPTAARQEAGPEAAPRIAQPDLFATRAPATELEAATVYEQRRAVEELSPRNIVANVALADPAFAEIAATYRTGGLQPALGAIRDRLAQGDLAPKQARQLQAVANTLEALEPTVQSGNAKQLVADAQALASLPDAIKKITTPEGKKQALSTAIGRQVTELEARQKRAAEEIAAAKELGLPEQTNAQAQAALQRYGLTPKTLGELPVQFKPDAPATETIQYMRDRNEVPLGVKSLAGVEYARADTPTQLKAAAALQADATQLGVKRAQRLISAATPNEPPSPRRFDIAYRAVEQVRLQAPVAPKPARAQAAPTPAAPTPAAPTAPAAPTPAATTQVTPTTPAAPTRAAPTLTTSTPTGAPIPQTALGLQITPAPAPALTPTIDLKANYAQTKTAQGKVKLYNAVRKVAPEGAKGEVAKGKAPSQEQFDALVDSISTPTEVTGAVSEQGAKSVPVREAPKTRRRVPKRDTQKREAPVEARGIEVPSQEAFSALGVASAPTVIRNFAQNVSREVDLRQYVGKLSSGREQQSQDAAAFNNLKSADAEEAAAAQQYLAGRVAENTSQQIQNIYEERQKFADRNDQVTVRRLTTRLNAITKALNSGDAQQLANVMTQVFPVASVQRTQLPVRSEAEQQSFTAAVRDMVNTITRAWRRPPQLLVMDYARPDQADPTQVALAKYMQKYVAQFGDVTGLYFSPDVIPADVPGLTKGRPLAVVFTNTSADMSEALATLYEEGLGHGGLHARYGQELNRITADMYRTNAAFRARVNEMLGSGVRPYADLVVAREEVLAQMLRDGELRASSYDKLVGMIRRFGRQIGLITAYSDNDIAQIVRLGQNAVLQDAPRSQRFTAVPVPTYELPQPPSLRGETLSAENAPRAAVGRYIANAVGQLFDRSATSPGLVTAMPLDRLVASAARLTPSAARFFELPQRKRFVKATIFGPLRSIDIALNSLPENSQTRSDIARFAGASVLADVDFRKPFAQQPHLQQSDFWQSPTTTAAQRRTFERSVDDLHRAWQDLSRRSADDRKLVEDMIAQSEAQQAMHHITSLDAAFNLMSDPVAFKAAHNIPLTRGVNPLYERFVNAKVMSTGLREDPQQFSAFVKNERDALVSAFKAALQPSAQLTALQQSDPTSVKLLKDMLTAIDSSIAANAKRPYFHAGRYGEYAVGFTLTSDAARGRVAQALEAAGLPNFELGQGTPVDPTRLKVFVRLETQDQQARFETVLESLPNDVASVQGGRLSQLPLSQTELGPLDEVYRRLDRRILSLQIPAAEADALRSTVKRVILDSTSDFSARKIYTEREGVPGFDQNFIRNFANSQRVSGYNAAYMAGLSQQLQAAEDLRTEVEALRTRTTGTGTYAQQAARANSAQVYADELTKRATQEYDAPFVTGAAQKRISQIRAGTHTYFLALNPSYYINNPIQLETYLLPQLIKDYGVRATEAQRAITSAATPAMRLVRAFAAEARARGGLKSVADVPLLAAALTKANLTPAQIDAVEAAIAQGELEGASMAQQLGTLVDAQDSSARLQNTLKYASALGAHSELFTRLVGTFAVQKLHAASNGVTRTHGTESIGDAVTRILGEALFNYHEYNSPRLISRRGPTGVVAPLVTPLYSYRIMATAKLLSEFSTMLSRDPSISAAQKEAARDFLVAHTAAIAVLGGVPAIFGVTLAATAINAIWGIFKSALGGDDEPPDVVGAFGMWLKQTFGPQVADAMMKGVTRPLLGFDVSRRLGEADLLPFMDVLTGRREMSELAEALAEEAAGAPFSAATQVLQGVRELMKFNFVQAAKVGAPIALRNLAKAYEMGSDGYFDTKGRPVPEVTPDARDVFWQALGYSPANIAEARERKRDWDSKTKPIRSQATELRRDLYRAVQANDAAQIRDVMARIERFDARNPDFEIMPTLKTALKQNQQKIKLSKQYGTPLSVPESQIPTFERLLGPAAYR